MVFGNWAITQVLGERWEVAGALTVAMTPWMFAQFVIVPLSQTMSVFHAHRVKLIYDVTSLIGSVLAVAVLATWGGSYLAAVWMLSGVNVGAYVLFYMLLRYSVLRGAPGQHQRSGHSGPNWKSALTT